jgi:hypothetical protein
MKDIRDYLIGKKYERLMGTVYEERFRDLAKGYSLFTVQTSYSVMEDYRLSHKTINQWLKDGTLTPIE